MAVHTKVLFCFQFQEIVWVKGWFMCVFWKRFSLSFYLILLTRYFILIDFTHGCVLAIARTKVGRTKVFIIGLRGWPSSFQNINVAIWINISFFTLIIPCTEKNENVQQNCDSDFSASFWNVYVILKNAQIDNFVLISLYFFILFLNSWRNSI